MLNATLEHANITITKLDETAELLCKVFDWTVRWSGTSQNGGRCMHIGSESSYLALCAAEYPAKPEASNSASGIGLNHVGVVVDDLAIIEKRVAAAGLTSHNHGNYEPGHRFYFNPSASIEIEVVSYT